MEQLGRTESVICDDEFMATPLNRSTLAQPIWLNFFCVSILIGLLLFAKSINGLSPIDDHQFIRSMFQGKSFGAYILPDLGRFIPLASQEYALASLAFKPSANMFHVIAGFKTFLCGALLLFAIRLTGVGPRASGTLWLTVVLSVGFANASTRLQIGEINALILLLIFICCTLILESNRSREKTSPPAIEWVGLLAFVLALFYKEIIFAFGLVFASSELIRTRRSLQGPSLKKIWLLFILSLSYLVIYGFWRLNQTSGSYVNFHAASRLDILYLYANNDPFLIFVILPLTIVRLLIITKTHSKHTLSDSFLFAASGYVAAFFVLSMYNTYYLLPAYGFAACGVAGLLVSNAINPRFRPLLFIIIFLGWINTLPTALSDFQSLRSIANNHFRFVKFLSQWLQENPMPNGEPRNLVLAGVSAGTGAEIIISLQTFLNSLSRSGAAFDIKVTEQIDNKVVNSYYGLEESSKYFTKAGDVVIFNPFQKVVTTPPMLVPSGREIFRSKSEWSPSRRTLLERIQTCTEKPDQCQNAFFGDQIYSGYAALLKTRTAPLEQLEPVPLKSPKYELITNPLASRLSSGSSTRRVVEIKNVGNEIWRSLGRAAEGMYVNASYVWLDTEGKIALEGDRFVLPESMYPGDSARVSLIIKTPIKPGRYTLELSPVQEGVRWFYLDHGVQAREKIGIYVEEKRSGSFLQDYIPQLRKAPE